MTDPLSRSIKAAGGPDAFVRHVGISPRTLADWRRFGVPDTRCIAVEKASGGLVTAQELSADRIARLRGSV